MFSKEITSSDKFLDMPMSARLLYYDLGMNADDDGFVSPRSVMRLTGASPDDLKILIAKHFLHSFGDPLTDGVTVILHWKVNNTLKNDRYRPTLYTDLFNLIKTEKNGVYEVKVETERIQNGT